MATWADPHYGFKRLLRNFAFFAVAQNTCPRNPLEPPQPKYCLKKYLHFRVDFLFFFATMDALLFWGDIACYKFKEQQHFLYLRITPIKTLYFGSTK